MIFRYDSRKDMTDDKSNFVDNMIIFGSIGIMLLILTVNVPESIYNYCTNNGEGIVLAQY